VDLSASFASKRHSMVAAHLPDEATLQALGVVAVRHAQLEYALRMTIKSVTGWDIEKALSATQFGATKLRENILDKAKTKLAQQADRDALANLIDRTIALTLRRNDVLHGLYARPETGGRPGLFANDAWQAVPTPDELTALAADIAHMADEIHEARLRDFLAKARRV